MRRSAALVTLVLLVGAGAPYAAAHAAGAARTPHARAASPTVVVSVRPVTASGKLAAGYRIVDRAGHVRCQPGSEATGDAYRCFGRTFIYDPCWVTNNTAFVDCLLEAYSHKVTRLHVTKGYDGTGGLGPRATLPWSLKVAGGKRATLLQGATGTVKAWRINYSLKGFSLVLVGGVNRHNATWTIREAKRSHGKYTIIGRVDVRTAWFGKRSRKG
jgi:hypothetical protein